MTNIFTCTYLRKYTFTSQNSELAYHLHSKCHSHQRNCCSHSLHRRRGPQQCSLQSGSHSETAHCHNLPPLRAKLRTDGTDNHTLYREQGETAKCNVKQFCFSFEFCVVCAVSFGTDGPSGNQSLGLGDLGPREAVVEKSEQGFTHRQSGASQCQIF